MSNRWLRTWVMFCLIAGLSGRHAGAAFAPLFQVAEVQGQCTAQVPGSTEAKLLQGGEGLAYGTVLRTAADSSVVVLLSPENRITVGGEATLVVDEDSANPATKIVNLHRGKLDVAMDKEFTKENGLEIVTRCVAVRYQSGGSSSIEATTEADLKVVVLNCRTGLMDARGPFFSVPILKDNDGLTIACSEDRGFLRLRCLSGKFGIQVKDSNGSVRLAEMVQDSVIKILQKASDADPNVTVVTILEVGADGNVIQADNFEQGPGGDANEPGGSGPPLLNSDEPGGGGGGTPPGGGGTTTTTQPGDMFPTTTSSTTTSTSTTTIPPGDVTTTTMPTTFATTTTTRVEDNTPPVVVCSGDIRVRATDASGAIVVYRAPIVTDSRDPDPYGSCVPPSGSKFRVGTTTVICTGTDGSGNQSFCSFTVTVYPDVTPTGRK